MRNTRIIRSMGERVGCSLRPIFPHNAAPLRRRARTAVSLPPPMDSGLALRTPVSTCSIQSGGATSKRGRYLTRREGSAHNRVGRVRASNGPPRTGSCKLNRKSASFLPRRSPGSSPGQEANHFAVACHASGRPVPKLETGFASASLRGGDRRSYVNKRR